MGLQSNPQQSAQSQVQYAQKSKGKDGNLSNRENSKQMK